MNRDLLFLLVSIWTSSLVNCQNRTAESLEFQLTASDSTVSMNRFPWDYNAPLTLEFNFQTRSFGGEMFALSATNIDGDIEFQLFGRVERRLLQIRMENNEGLTVAKINSFNLGVSDGEEHKLSIELNLIAENFISIELDNQEDRQTITGALEISDDADISLLFGKLPKNNDVYSITACISEVEVSIGDIPLHLNISDYILTSSEPVGCSNPCDALECNLGSCVNIFNGIAQCDCIGTGKEGASCDQDSTVVTFNGDNYLEYTLPSPAYGPSETQRIQNFSLSFKSNKVVQNNGVLLYILISSEKEFIVEHLIISLTNNGTVALESISMTKPVEFTGLAVNDGNWHSLQMHLNYATNILTLVLDDQTQTVDCNIMEGDTLFIDRVFYVGGTLPGDDDVGEGFYGCMKDVYFGLTSVLFLAKEGSDMVKVGSGNLELGCSTEETIIPLVTAESLEEEPNSTMAEVTEETSLPAEDDEEETESDSDDEQETEMPWVGPNPVNCEGFNCRNGGICFIDAMTYAPKCQCPEGYGGTYCQFSLLMKHCTELFLVGERGNGVYQIDLDGSQPMTPVYVTCQFDNATMGKTVVSHNFPNQTRVRAGKLFKDSAISISYRMMPLNYLTELMDISESCQQFIQYDCIQAPLQLNKNTWFGSVQNSRFAQIGDDPGKCPCYNSPSGCDGFRSGCNCDSNENTERKDEGWLTGTMAGLTRMTVIQYSNQNWGKFTLGPLTCYGTNSVHSTITFLNKDSFLTLPAWQTKTVSLWFKTSKSTSLLMKQDEMELWVAQGHVAEIKLNRKDVDFTSHAVTLLRSVSQGRLNDSAWHKIVLEFSDNELRLSIDKITEYLLIDSDLKLNFVSPMSLGGASESAEGFTGCIRELIIDGESIALEDRIGDEFGIEIGCPNSCYPNPCQNDAECSQNFEMGTYNCICKNPWAHSGRDCEHNVNIDSSVSFLTRDQSFLTYRDLTTNPVVEPITFSFRTDQSSALLSYAFDQNYNFVQVHLWDDKKVSLTVSYNRTIYRCTVSVLNRDFSDMDWNQVSIRYEEEYTALFVDHEMCIVKGARVISSSYIKEFELGTEYINVFPPRPPVAPENNADIEPFTLLYVAGVPKPAIGRMTVYITDLSSLLGCMRGFQVGNVPINLRFAGQRSGNIRDGCDTSKCDSLTCSHGGHCTIDWGGLLEASCDCSKTSYSGPSCLRDIGLQFNGEAVLKYEIGKILRQRVYLPPSRPPSTLSYAFSTAGNNSPRQLARLQMSDNSPLDVIITEDGSLEFRLKLSGLNSEKFVAFQGNYSNGQRHFVFIKFKGTIEVTVDSISKDMNVREKPMDLADLDLLILGGSQVQLEATYPHFIGCISNAKLDFRLGPNFLFTPITFFADPETGDVRNRDTVSVIPQGANLSVGACAQYTGALPVPVPTATYPPWEVPLKRGKYVPPSGPKEDGGGGGGGIIVAIILGILLLIVIVFVLGYLWYVKCYKNRSDDDVITSHYHKGQDLESPPPKGPGKVKDPSATPEEKVALNGDSPENEMNLNPAPIPNDPNTGGSPLYSPINKPAPVPSPVAPLHVGPLPSHMDVPEATENLDDPEPDPPNPPVQADFIENPAQIMMRQPAVNKVPALARCSEMMEI